MSMVEKYFYLWPEVGSASHKSCAASARATNLNILRRKRFRKPQKIIAPQAQPLAQVWRFEMCNSNWLTAQTSLGHGTKLIFKTNYARYQTSKQKILDFLWKLQAFENEHCLTSLGEEHIYTKQKNALDTRIRWAAVLKNSTNKACMWS